MSIKNLLPKFPDLKYVSIGDGDERRNLERLRKELGLEKNVELILNLITSMLCEKPHFLFFFVGGIFYWEPLRVAVFTEASQKL